MITRVRTWARLTWAILGVWAALAGAGVAGTDPRGDEAGAAAVLERVRSDPAKLEAFLRAMPKGGDLHNHLNGAIFAESFLDRARTSGLCLDPVKLSIEPPPCTGARRPAGQALDDTPGLEARMVDSLSMRNFRPGPGSGETSGHDHFFSAFSRFDTAADDPGAMLAEAVTRAAADHTQYVEFIWEPGLRDAIRMGERAAWTDEQFARDLATIAPANARLVARARIQLDAAERRMRDLLHCGRPDAQPGCGVAVRYQAFVLRAFPPRTVFAQMAFAYGLARADPRFVGVNIVQPEDDPVALRDYSLHMRFFAFFRRTYPRVKLSLHAGELSPALAGPADLAFHIRDAVEVAGASRIGHGVDIAHERDAQGLMAEMARRGVAVEINLTSNDQILGVDGPGHPFAAYRAAGVPVALSTDDPGLERIDLTHEYVRAARTWSLSYPELKALSRNAVRYSFLPGAPLPAGADGAPRAFPPALLANSEKARMQQRLEQKLAAFERQVASGSAR